MLRLCWKRCLIQGTFVFSKLVINHKRINRALHHSHSAVRSRAYYLLHRFIKDQKHEINPELATSILSRIADTLVIDVEFAQDETENWSELSIGRFYWTLSITPPSLILNCTFSKQPGHSSVCYGVLPTSKQICFATSSNPFCKI